MWRMLDLLFPPRADVRVLREVSDADFLTRLTPRLVSETRPGTAALLSYGDAVVRAAIHEAKYHGSEHAFRLLSLSLIEYLRDADDLGRSPLIVPVPLGARRRKERGYNQVEEVAKRAAKELTIELEPGLLVRTRETASQVSLPRESREANMRGAFGTASPLDPTRTYIVIDDVVTTGATLQAAYDALTDAGATHIIPIALAH
jgi:ComF family protein